MPTRRLPPNEQQAAASTGGYWTNTVSVVLYDTMPLTFIA